MLQHFAKAAHVEHHMTPLPSQHNFLSVSKVQKPWCRNQSLCLSYHTLISSYPVRFAHLQ